METKFRQRQGRKKSETRMYVGGRITSVHEEQPGRDKARARLYREPAEKLTSASDAQTLARVHGTPQLQAQSTSTNDPTKDNAPEETEES